MWKSLFLKLFLNVIFLLKRKCQLEIKFKSPLAIYSQGAENAVHLERRGGSGGATCM